MLTVMSETENQEEKKPELEINKGVELMLRNKKKIVHIYFEFSIDIRKGVDL